jgi:alpha-glucosidase
MATWSELNTTLPFTRFLAGHGDYTPLIFGDRRKETSWAHQIATVAAYTSPVMILGANPKSILDNPAVDMIKSIPTVWDETIALPCSEIGEIAAFARRKGDTWFLTVLNGPTERSLQIPLSFLEKGTWYNALIVCDRLLDPATVKLEKAFTRNTDTFPIKMRAGGGYIARFTK